MLECHCFLLHRVKMWFPTGGSGPKSGPQEALRGLKVKKMFVCCFGRYLTVPKPYVLAPHRLLCGLIKVTRRIRMRTRPF